MKFGRWKERTNKACLPKYLPGTYLLSSLLQLDQERMNQGNNNSAIQIHTFYHDQGLNQIIYKHPAHQVVKKIAVKIRSKSR